MAARIADVRRARENKGPKIVILDSQNPRSPNEDVVVHSRDMRRGRSEVVVASAEDMREVARLEMPARVPSGFHALFVSREQEMEVAREG